MKAIEQRLPKDFDKSFIVFRETGGFFPCPWHYHPEYELVVVTKSTGKRIVGDHIGYFAEGDLVFMGAQLPHVWVNDPKYLERGSKETADAFVVHFTEDFLGQDFMKIPEMTEFKKVLVKSERGMAIKGKARTRINSLMRKMYTMNGIERLSSLMLIFDILSSTKEYELLASPSFVQNFQFESSDRFQQVTEYIMNNFERNITLPEIASVANMGLTAFCNFFKVQYRVTFVEYLTTVRVGHACKLLSEKEHNISEIAYDCGFNNLANFNRQFRKIKKMTPGDYRRTLSLHQ